MTDTEPPVSSIRHVAVIIPAANEEESIDRTLQAVGEALAVAYSARSALSAMVVVVLDSCTDATADIVARRTEVHAVRCDAGRVGAARARGTSFALAATTENRVRVWTAHTDADSLVPSDWLVHQLELADSGHGMVLGTVVPDLDDGLRPLWQAAHDATDLHPHIHGANLGIRADVLQAVGGWRNLAEHEDADLVERVVRDGYAVARSGRIPVATSARVIGKTPGGMAGYLRALTASSQTTPGFTAVGR